MRRGRRPGGSPRPLLPRHRRRNSSSTTRYDRPFDDPPDVQSVAGDEQFVADWVGRPLATEELWNATIKVDPDHPVEVAFDRASGLVGADCSTAPGPPSRTSRSSWSSPIAPPRCRPARPRSRTGGHHHHRRPQSRDRRVLRHRALGESVDLARAIGARTGHHLRPAELLRAELDRIFQSRTAREQVAQQLVDDVPAMQGASLSTLSLFGILPDPHRRRATPSVGLPVRAAIRRSTSPAASAAAPDPHGLRRGVPCPVRSRSAGSRDGTGTVMLHWIHPLPVDVERSSRRERPVRS